MEGRDNEILRYPHSTKTIDTELVQVPGDFVEQRFHLLIIELIWIDEAAVHFLTVRRKEGLAFEMVANGPY